MAHNGRGCRKLILLHRKQSVWQLQWRARNVSAKISTPGCGDEVEVVTQRLRGRCSAATQVCFSFWKNSSFAEPGIMPSRRSEVAHVFVRNSSTRQAAQRIILRLH